MHLKVKKPVILILLIIFLGVLYFTFNKKGILFTPDGGFAPLTPDGRCKKYVSGDVLVVTKDGVSTEEAFNLFNKYNLIIKTFGGSYKSALSEDQVDHIINIINSKPYVNPVWKLTRGAVYPHYLTKELNVEVHFENLDKNNQTDWLNTKNQLQLKEENLGMSFHLRVPIRQEGKYIRTLNKYPIVKAAEVNCINTIQIFI